MAGWMGKINALQSSPVIVWKTGIERDLKIGGEAGAIV